MTDQPKTNPRLLRLFALALMQACGAEIHPEPDWKAEAERILDEEEERNVSRQ